MIQRWGGRVKRGSRRERHEKNRLRTMKRKGGGYRKKEEGLAISLESCRTWLQNPLRLKRLAETRKKKIRSAASCATVVSWTSDRRSKKRRASRKDVQQQKQTPKKKKISVCTRSVWAPTRYSAADHYHVEGVVAGCSHGGVRSLRVSPLVPCSLAAERSAPALKAPAEAPSPQAPPTHSIAADLCSANRKGQ